MSNALYELHLQDVMKLSKTLVIKSEASANVLNNRIRLINRPVNDADPTTWKYYLNLAGEYHDLDEPMSVKSLDTLTEIPFTKENLMVHRGTAKAYSYGTPYYRSLVNRFPKQEQLIRGILNPVDLQTAIAAPNHKILWYDKTLVDPNEANLIEQLQLYIDAWWRKWDSPEYRIYHELYDAGLYSAFFAAIPGAILGIRLRNCHTPFAHSFHIWSYLAGKGHLDEFQEYLTTKQTLWLYRNINWLTANVGKNKAHEELIQHLLTERGFPLVGYSLIQNVSEMPEALTPNVDCVQRPLNFLDQQPRQRQVRDVATLVEKELPLARENELYTAQEIEDTIDEVRHNEVTNIGTRVFESQVVDRSESKHVRLPDVLLNHWLYLSHSKRYSAVLSVTHPQTGDAFNIGVKDAFVLWLWLFNKSMDMTLTTVPTVMAKRVRRPQLPTFDSLRALSRPQYVTDRLIRAFYDDQPPYGLIVSTAAFNELGRDLYKADLKQYSLYTRQEHMISRVEAELVGLAFWMDAECTLAPAGTTYSQWFKERSLLMEELSKFDCATLAAEILDKATGQDLSKQYTLKEIHTAMLSLFKRLNAYTVQVIQSITDSPVVPVGFPPIRIGDDLSSDHDHSQVLISDTEVIKDRSKDCDRLSAKAVGITSVTERSSRDRDRVNIEPILDVYTKGPARERIRVRLPNLRWTVQE